MDTAVTLTLSQEEEEITIIINKDRVQEAALDTPCVLHDFEAPPPLLGYREALPAAPSYEAITPTREAVTVDAASQTEAQTEDQRWRYCMAAIQALQYQLLGVHNYIISNH